MTLLFLITALAITLPVWLVMLIDGRGTVAFLARTVRAVRDESCDMESDARYGICHVRGDGVSLTLSRDGVKVAGQELELSAWERIATRIAVRRLLRLERVASRRASRKFLDTIPI